MEINRQISDMYGDRVMKDGIARIRVRLFNSRRMNVHVIARGGPSFFSE